MDPNANLAEQARILADPDQADRLRELREALAAWLGNGGFIPDTTAHAAAWNAYRFWISRGRPLRVPF